MASQYDPFRTAELKTRARSGAIEGVTGAVLGGLGALGQNFKNKRLTEEAAPGLELKAKQDQELHDIKLDEHQFKVEDRAEDSAKKQEALELAVGNNKVLDTIYKAHSKKYATAATNAGVPEDEIMDNLSLIRPPTKGDTVDAKAVENYAKQLGANYGQLVSGLNIKKQQQAIGSIPENADQQQAMQHLMGGEVPLEQANALVKTRQSDIDNKRKQAELDANIKRWSREAPKTGELKAKGRNALEDDYRAVLERITDLKEEKTPGSELEIMQLNESKKRIFDRLKVIAKATGEEAPRDVEGEAKQGMIDKFKSGGFNIPFFPDRNKSQFESEFKKQFGTEPPSDLGPLRNTQQPVNQKRFNLKKDSTNPLSQFDKR